MLCVRGGASRMGCVFLQITRCYQTASSSPLNAFEKLRLSSHKVMGFRHQALNAPLFLTLNHQLSLSSRRSYKSLPDTKEKNMDLKLEAVDIFTTAIRSVRPKAMIENFLEYDETTSTLKVQDKVYHLNRNVFVVGFGKAVLGMARVVEDMLGKHMVTGIISIPKGLQEEMRQAQNKSMLLAEKSKISVYEGALNNEVDDHAYEAAKSIHSLVSKLEKKDLLIVLCSGGGSPLCPSPYPPITLQELHEVSKLLTKRGASIEEINTVRKNIEILKGGGLALAARPAKVLALIFPSVINDPPDMTASGPTFPTQPTPHHCIEILNRLNIMDKTPESIRQFLAKECKTLAMLEAQSVRDPILEKREQDAMWKNVQNVTVGNNSVACEAASHRASEFGYLPLILTKVLSGQSRHIGYLYAKLAKFIMMCYDRKASLGPNIDLAMLETNLVAGGIRKAWINHICQTVDMAHNMNKDLCIIAGGQTTVHVTGTGVGGQNLEAALAAAIQMQEEFRNKEIMVTETRMCFLSCDSDGQDGVTKFAGAVVDQEFLDKVEKTGLDMQEYLDNNDSLTFFQNVDNGNNLICTNLTGTNVADIIVMLVQRPREQKLQRT